MNKTRRANTDQVEARLASGDDRLLHRKALAALREGIRRYVASGGAQG